MREMTKWGDRMRQIVTNIWKTREMLRKRVKIYRAQKMVSYEYWIFDKSEQIECSWGTNTSLWPQIAVFCTWSFIWTLYEMFVGFNTKLILNCMLIKNEKKNNQVLENMKFASLPIVWRDFWAFLRFFGKTKL